MSAESTTTIVKTRCPAKINLTFEILGLLPDGYHEVRTLMQTVSLEDELTFEFSSGSGNISFASYESSFTAEFPKDESNLISKAIRAYQNEVSEAKSLNVKVRIRKLIPIAAGLAGGSANAAATLVAMNHHLKQIVSKQRLLDLAGQLGADVPFSLVGGTRIGSGKGDKLSSAIQVNTEMTFVLVKPRNLHVSTPWAFKKFDELFQKDAKDDATNHEGCISGLKDASPDRVAQHLVNDLELPLFSEYTELEKIRSSIEQCGALAARLTGSGPTLYGITRTLEEAVQLQNKLQHVHSSNSNDQSSLFPLDYWIANATEAGARVISC